MRFAGEEELAARGLGDGCGDLMFFSSVLDFFIYYGSLVVSYRLVPPSRSCVPWSVSPFLPAVSLLARIVLISSRAGVSSGISFLISFYPRAALLIVSSCRLAEASCLLVSFSFHSSCLRRLADLDMAFLRGRRATVSFRWA